MKPPSVKRITASDLGDFGVKLAPFLNQFNNFSQQVVDLFSKGLNLSDNVESQLIIYTGNLQPFIQQKIRISGIRSTPQCVILAKIKQVNPPALTTGTTVSIEWETDGEYIYLTAVNGSFIADTVYQLNLLVF